METKRTINPNTLKTRDPLMLLIIGGATKAGIRKDRRKEKNRKECRDFRANRAE
jgi:hypothetical protein